MQVTEIHQAPPAIRGIETGADVIARQLEEGLAKSRHNPSRALLALGALAPERCLRVLAEHGDELTHLIEPAITSRAVETALQAAPGPSGLGRDVILGALAACGDRLSSDALAAAFTALGDLDTVGNVELENALRRFPENPTLLRVAVRAARLRGASPACLESLLVLLWRADGSPTTTGFVRRELRELPKPAGPKVRIALASSFTIDHLVPHVEIACRAAGLAPEIYVAPFNSWATDVIDASSALHRFAPDVLFLAIAIDDLVPQLSGAPSRGELEHVGNSALERVVQVARTFTLRAPGTTLVVHSFHSAFAGPLGVLEGRGEPSRAEWLARLNGRLAEVLRGLPSAFVLDVPAAAHGRGGSLRDNAKLRHMAAMRLPPTALPGIAEAYARYAAPLKGMTRKCVVLDLDNTLWGGTVGEDGRDDIRLGHTSPGSEYVEFQEFLQTLARRGVLLAINSKNNPDDALEVLRTHESMVLGETAFSAVRINWKPKHENMVSIAQELNIGLDSMVFVDDNPEEREQMRKFLPQVLTLELPRDPSLYRGILENLPGLQALAVTVEDTMRVEQYRSVRLRERAKSTSTTVDEYLRSLGIEVEIRAATRPVAARIVQLFARTNQFNVTTRRYDTADVERFMTDPKLRLWTLCSKDRFGDHGLVAIALVRTAPAWAIDSFLMSCRVIGYGIETSLLAFIADRARAAGSAELLGEFIETKKNAPAKSFFKRHGFALATQSNGVEHWRLSLGGTVPQPPAWIGLETRDA